MDKLLIVRDKLGKVDQEKFWRIGEKTGLFLQDLLRRNKAKTVLEIGTSSGYSALWILEVLREIKGAKLYTVESHKERFELARGNFAEAEVSELVEQIKGHAPEVIYELKENLKFDLVFIDATKAETQIHFEAAWPRLNSGGIIVIDNIATHREKFADFFKFLEKKGISYTEEEIEAGLLIVNS